MSQRAILIASLGQGKRVIKNVLHSDDTRVIIAALKKMGVRIVIKGTTLTITGCNGHLKKPKSPLFLENAGTAMRFLTAATSLADGPVTLTGNARMRERPIRDLITALNNCGVNAQCKKGCPPVHNPGGGIPGGTVTINGHSSSQYVSALLMVAPYADKKLHIKVRNLTSAPYVTLTKKMMQDVMASRTYTIEPDYSSAVYPLAMGILLDKKISIKNLPQKSLQPDAQILPLLTTMPEKIACENFPDGAVLLAVLALLIDGKTTLTGLHTLRIKETDRIAVLVNETKKIGGVMRSTKNTLTIYGAPSKLHSGIIDPHDDHRIAMSFAVLGSVIPGIKILNKKCVRKSYPTFWKDYAKILDT